MDEPVYDELVVDLIREAADIVATFDDRLSFDVQTAARRIQMRFEGGRRVEVLSISVYEANGEIKIERDAHGEPAAAVYRGPFDKPAIRSAVNLSFGEWYGRVVRQLKDARLSCTYRTHYEGIEATVYGAPLNKQAVKLMILGSGELGKEVIIEAQRLGVETIAVDRYANAPAMQVAHRSHVVTMTDGQALERVIREEMPDFIVPEIEAIATDTLVALEQAGFRVIPTANAARLTMDREGIRRLAAEELGLKTAKYAFANTLEEFRSAVDTIGLPCVVKPIMSSSGKGQSVCRTRDDVEKSWNYAMTAGRVQQTRVIVEEFIHFTSEITLLTVRSVSGTSFCPPIGHRQENGDYIESWQPHAMSDGQLAKAQDIARRITDALGGRGIFGVELFLTDDDVYFSEVSPRPHDTGMVTLATQNLSEFSLHVRAILGFPIPDILQLRPGASHALKSPVDADDYVVNGVAEALSHRETQLRLFGKPVATVGRRIGVVLSTGDSVEDAKREAAHAAAEVKIYGKEG